jgi:hypothetical protein
MLVSDYSEKNFVIYVFHSENLFFLRKTKFIELLGIRLAIHHPIGPFTKQEVLSCHFGGVFYYRPSGLQRLDGCYTRMLRTAFNMSWREHLTLEEIYGNLPRISQVLRERRLRFAGHCFRRING